MLKSCEESQCNLEKWRATNWRGGDMMKQTERKKIELFGNLFGRYIQFSLCRSVNSSTHFAPTVQTQQTPNHRHTVAVCLNVSACEHIFA